MGPGRSRLGLVDLEASRLAKRQETGPGAGGGQFGGNHDSDVHLHGARKRWAGWPGARRQDGSAGPKTASERKMVGGEGGGAANNGAPPNGAAATRSGAARDRVPSGFLPPGPSRVTATRRRVGSRRHDREDVSLRVSPARRLSIQLHGQANWQSGWTVDRGPGCRPGGEGCGLTPRATRP